MRKLLITLLVFYASCIFAEKTVITAAIDAFGVFKLNNNSDVQIGAQYDLYRPFNNGIKKVGRVEVIKIQGGESCNKIDKRNINRSYGNWGLY